MLRVPSAVAQVIADYTELSFPDKFMLLFAVLTVEYDHFKIIITGNSLRRLPHIVGYGVYWDISLLALPSIDLPTLPLLPLVPFSCDILVPATLIDKVASHFLRGRDHSSHLDDLSVGSDEEFFCKFQGNLVFLFILPMMVKDELAFTFFTVGSLSLFIFASWLRCSCFFLLLWI